jgi:hypothetical protein
MIFSNQTIVGVPSNLDIDIPNPDIYGLDDPSFFNYDEEVF